MKTWYDYGILWLWVFASNDDTTWRTEQNWVANLLSAISVLVREVPVLPHTHTHAQMEGSINRGAPTWMVYNGRSNENEWFGGYPYLGKAPNVFPWRFNYSECRAKFLNSMEVDIELTSAVSEKLTRKPKVLGLQDTIAICVKLEATQNPGWLIPMFGLS